MTVSSNECAAMRLLARDGWATGELKMTMHISRGNNVTRHVRGECSHNHGTDAVTDYDGRKAPGADLERGEMALAGGERL